MNDKQLRSKLIRLAHANLKLRGDILPLLTKTKQASQGKVAVSRTEEILVNRYGKGISVAYTATLAPQNPDMHYTHLDAIVGFMQAQESKVHKMAKDLMALGATGSADNQVEPSVSYRPKDNEAKAKLLAVFSPADVKWGGYSDEQRLLGDLLPLLKRVSPNVKVNL